MDHIVIIGAGNVATHLTLALKNSGCIINQVYSRSISNADCLARLVDAEPIDTLKNIITDADFYFLSVSDSAITSVVEMMPRVSGIVVHTAGSIPMTVLEKFNMHGVFYPFQTFTKDRGVDFSKIPVLIEGNRSDVRRELTRLAATISRQVVKADSSRRAALHVAAVFSCNFVNHMYAISQDLLQRSDLDFELLKPLIAETTQKALSMNPVDAQTGPARRKDFGVMGEHLEKLASTKNYKEIYELISKSIVETYYPGSPFFS